jgi:hypothetical protein
MKPTPGKYYYINYEDDEHPEGSYFGVARYVNKYERNEKGENLKEPMYEFEHPDKDGKLVLSLFMDSEIIFEAK